MKRVKLCMNCHTYNPKKMEKCLQCGFRLDPTIYEVEDDVTHFHQEDIKKDEQVSQSKIEETILIDCPRCGSVIDSSLSVCPTCQKVITEDIIRTSVHKEVKIKDVILLFKNGLQNFKLVVNEEKQFFGRDYPPFLEISTISRKHFIYYLKDNVVYIEDISTNGTKINQIKLFKQIPYPLKNHDRITLAQTEFECEIHAY